MSATFFNFTLHKVLRGLNLAGNILYSCNQICDYADHICLAARNEQTLKEILNKIDTQGKERDSE